MPRLPNFQQFIERSATGIEIASLPPAASQIAKCCRGELPIEYWKLALVTKAYIHESTVLDRDAAARALQLLETYGNWSFDWAVRRHAVQIKKCSDVKRLSDASAAAPLLTADTPEWNFETCLLHGKGGLKDAAPTRSAFNRLCG